MIDKWFILGRNFKEPKTCKNDSAITLQYFYAKMGKKKTHLMFDKWHDFEK